jgi:hypothetical protein
MLSYSIMSHHLKCKMFQKIDPFPSSDVIWGKNPTQLGPLEGANFDHWFQ